MTGQATYALLDLVFLVVAVLVAAVAVVVAGGRVARERGADAARRWRRVSVLTGAVAGVVLLVATVVFDNVIVGVGIVAYAADRISGARIGVVPVEDLAYAVGAVLLLPSLAVLLAPRARTDPSSQATPTPRPTTAPSGPRPAPRSGARR